MLQLYNADARGVTGTRICPLPDVTEAVVRREINGEYSLSSTLSRGARHENEIQIGRAIKAAVNEAGTEQTFIIKRRTRSLTGGISVYAEHQSYLYNGLILGAGDAIENGQPRIVFLGIRKAAVPDITDISTWTYSRSSSLRAKFPCRDGPITVMAGLKDHLVGNAGGELIFDGFNVEYVDAMGADKGAFYRYGVNLTELESEDILDGYASGIYPFWGRKGDADRPLTILADPVLPYSGTFPLQVIIPVDLTDKFDAQPSQAQLLAAAQEYAALNTPTGVPISLNASRVKISSEVPVDLGDTVTVICTPWGLTQQTRIQALNFDALRGRVIDVELGTVNPGFAGAVKNMK